MALKSFVEGYFGAQVAYVYVVAPPGRLPLGVNLLTHKELTAARQEPPLVLLRRRGQLRSEHKQLMKNTLVVPAAHLPQMVGLQAA